MINVVIDKSGSMNTLGKPEVIQSIIREIQLTEEIEEAFKLANQLIGQIENSDE